MSPGRKKMNNNVAAETELRVEQSPPVPDGSIPDPESLDFEEYEDEDPGTINENGEQNEEPAVPDRIKRPGENDNY
jgi:hypothetical protein